VTLLLALLSQVLVDQVIAVVDKEALTHSELLANARIALVAREGARGVTVAEDRLDADLVASLRDYLLDQVLIAQQIRRLGGPAISEEQTEREVARFAAKFPSRAAYEAFIRKYDISERTLRQALRRDLQNDAYIQQRIPQGDGRDEALAQWLAQLRGSARIRLLGESGELELVRR
jgi:hypothetical protein